MSRIVELNPSFNFEDVVATKGAGYKPDFRILTAGIESDRTNNRLVHMIGSSTEKDLQGDTMSVLALQSMTKAAPNLTVWLNHDYSLPDSMFGSIIQTPTIHHRDGVADLHLDVDVELGNPAAARVKQYIDNGRRLGCSIGCMVTKYEVAEEEDGEEWAMQPIIIHDVYVVEYSVVGIPANQRSWVENAIRGVFTRTLDPALAPAMKALWPSRYEEALKSVSSEQRKSFDALPSRPRPSARLDWQAHTKTFLFSERGGKQKTLAAEDVRSLMNEHVELSKDQITSDASDAFLDESIEKEIAPNEINPQEAQGQGEINHSNGIYDDEHFVRLHDDNKTHDAFEGQHTHNHEAYGYKNLEEHSHTHVHKYDNNHNHSHDDLEGKAMSGIDKVAQYALNKDGTQGILLRAADDGKTMTHDVYKGTHTHHHDSVGHGDVDKHVHEHFHDNDNDHAHDHREVAMGENAAKEDNDNDDDGKKKAVELDAVRTTFLSSYNSVGKTLGLPEVTPAMLLRAQHPATEEPTLTPSLLAQLQSAHTTLGLIIEGKPVENHDHQDSYAIVRNLGEKMEGFTRAFSNFDVLALRKDADETRATIAVAKKELDVLMGEVKQAGETLARLKNMPLGNPVGHSRSVHEEDSVASAEDFLTTKESKRLEKATDSLSQAFSLTEITAEEYGNGQVMRVRSWPDGVGGAVGKGVRPPLTVNQIQFMDFKDVSAYREGREARVPYLDNQIASA